jgi:hypothetical protein
MVRLFGEEMTRGELLRRVGALDQIAGTRRVRLEDGPEDGVSAIEVRTGGGLAYTVLPSRALDLAAAECDGIPLAWRSGNGDVHPAYTYRALGWNAGWFGGLLATCGLDNIGAPGEDDLGPYAQHGNINGVAARQVCHGGRWEGDRHVFWVEGELRQKHGWMATAYDVVVRRRIESELGGRTIAIRDEVENLAPRPAPLMLLYHVNLGWPLVAPGAEVISRNTGVAPVGGGVAVEPPGAVVPPAADYAPVVHDHQIVADAEGTCEAALLNDRLAMGLVLRFPHAELPSFKHWKALVDGRNVIALEPTNCVGAGRARERELGRLPMLDPGEVRVFHLEVTVARGEAELAAVRARLARA